MRFLTAMIVVVLIATAAVVWGDKARSELVQTNVALSSSKKPKPAHCPGARRGLNFYRDKYTQHRKAMWLEGAPPARRYDCAATARRAAEWRIRARQAQKAHARWTVYHFHWWVWLPDKWQRIGACETGYGKRPGNWRHSNGSYQGAFGFAIRSWDDFAPRADRRAGPYPSEAYLATPRQQYEVALAIYRVYGLSGWGCRGA